MPTFDEIRAALKDRKPVVWAGCQVQEITVIHVDLCYERDGDKQKVSDIPFPITALKILPPPRRLWRLKAAPEHYAKAGDIDHTFSSGNLQHFKCRCGYTHGRFLSELEQFDAPEKCK